MLNGLVGLALASLCVGQEVSVWDCESAAGKRYELCRSPVLDGEQGYLVYRAGRPGQLELTFPATLRHPRGLFTHESTWDSSAITFTVGRTQYSLVEPIRASAFIGVTRGSDFVPVVRCTSGTDGLSLNDNLALFERAGVRRAGP